jgi:FlaA1/EpsC-like NDP-sugar epimerase
MTPTKHKSLLAAHLRFASAVFACVSFAIAFNVFVRGAGMYFPHVEVMASSSKASVAGEGDLTLEFVFHARPNMESCEAITGNVARNTLSSCPNCVIKRFECLDQLIPPLDLYLSDAPVAVPTGAMKNGVVAFRSGTPDTALAACLEAQRQSATTGNPIVCYPVGLERPVALAGRATMEEELGRFLTVLVALLAGLAATYQAASGNSAVTAARIALAKIARILEALPGGTKQIIMFASDSVGLWFAIWLAYGLRTEEMFSPSPLQLALFAIAPLIAAPIFVSLGLYRAVVRFLGVQALWSVIKATTVYGTAIWGIAAISGIAPPHRSAFILNIVFAAIFVGVPRLVARGLFAGSRKIEFGRNHERSKVAIYGAGSAGIQLAMALSASQEVEVAAFIDDAVEIHGRQIAGIQVYRPGDVESLIGKLEISSVLLALPSISRRRRQEIISMLERYPVRVQTLPSMAELAGGGVQLADLREIDVEDLLGRDAVTPVTVEVDQWIAGKVVMVTGAGGSIGSELCRQLLALKPTRIVLYEQSEFNLYMIDSELRSRSASVDVVPVMGSVTEQGRLEEAMRRFSVAVVFHAAAYKHVPLVELNPVQGVQTNTLGTWYTASAALATGVETFVLVSTDKAVRPTNTMGTTKRLAEMVLQSLQSTHEGRTRFSMVRFGNVLDSSGSVIPLFRRQIRAGGPVTVTDPRVTRYFMTIPEAAGLVLQAGAMGEGGDLFVLHMGEPVRIVDLARRMVHLSGLQVRDADMPDGDIEIQFIGLRPGEKLFEELLIGNTVEATKHPRILRAREPTLPWDALEQILQRLEVACEHGASEQIRAVLCDAVPEFSPQCGNQDVLLSQDAGTTIFRSSRSAASATKQTLPAN